ncbi:MAG: SpoIIE family protein phosphatase [Pirellulaceae bacterium]|nr:SpoIIE family protein phosphatase [Pirellulaceae bacterium]
MAVLRVLKGETPRKEFPLEAARVRIGRLKRDNDFELPDPHEKREVSKQHFEVIWEDDRHYLVDAGSRNGTFLNNHRLTPHVRYPLKHDDVVRVCNFMFVYLDPQSGTWSEGDSDDESSVVDLVEDTTGIDPPEVYSSIESSYGSWESRAAMNAEVKLRAIMRIVSELYRAKSLNEVLAQVLDQLLALFTAAECAIIVFRENESGGRLFPSVVRHRNPDAAERTRVSRTIVHEVLTTQKSLVLLDVGGQYPLDEKTSIAVSGLKSIMCAPVVDLEGKSLAVLQLDTRTRPHRFQEEDLDVLLLVTHLLTSVIEATLRQAEAHEQLARQSEMRVARELQLGLLPSEPPAIPGYQFFDYYAPAREVGGDYYDYRLLPDERLAIVVGDVEGKGVPAAMLVTKLMGEIRVLLASGAPPDEVFNQVNRSYQEPVLESRLVTMLLLVLDFRTHELQIVCAGHPRPLLLRGGRPPEELADLEARCPLGVIPNQQYPVCRVKLEPGDCVVLYTDGVTEAKDSANELYDTERLVALLSGSSSPAPEVGERIMAALQRFMGQRAQADDLCVVCFSRDK